MITKIKYLYPIVLKNKKLFSFDISPEITLRRITRSERKEFFGVEKLDFSFSQGFPLGFIGFSKFYPPKSKARARCPYSSLLKRGLFDGSSDILASNYVLSVECQNSPHDLLERLNLSFKLFKPTSSGAYIGFKIGETDVSFHNPMPIHGPFDYLYLKKNNLREIKKTFLLIEKNKNDKKFMLYSKLYTRALAGSDLPLDLRFLLLIMALESLYLPKRDAELKFRLSFRIANLLCKYKYAESKAIYEEIIKIYGIRSDLVHCGKTSKLNEEIFLKTTNIVRVSLNLYLQDKEVFSEESLTDINLF